MNAKPALAALAVAALAALATATPAHAAGSTDPVPANITDVAGASAAIVDVTFSAYADLDGSAGDILLDKDDPFTVTYQCSAFVVDPDGYLATAASCVQATYGAAGDLRQKAVDYVEDVTGLSQDQFVDDVTLYIVEDGKVKLDLVNRDVVASFSSAVTGGSIGKEVDATIVSEKKSDSVALLHVPLTNINALPLAHGLPTPGDAVAVVGYDDVISDYTSTTLRPTAAPTTVSSAKRGGEAAIKLGDEVSGYLEGAPVVNANGEVVGVNTWLDVVSGLQPLRELLADEGLDAEPSAITRDFREGVAAVAAGDKETAVDLLSGVVSAQPGNRIATRYLTAAKALPNPEPAAAPETAESVDAPSSADAAPAPVEADSSSLPIFIGVGAAGLVLIALAIAVPRRRRSAATVQPYFAPVPAQRAQFAPQFAPQVAPQVAPQAYAAPSFTMPTQPPAPTQQAPLGFGTPAQAQPAQPQPQPQLQTQSQPMEGSPWGTPYGPA